jgi:acetylglutamate kinase
MDNNKLRVKYLSEALPYIQKYSSKIIVIKYGGSALQNPEIECSVIKDLVLLNSVGIKVVLVHGGGPEINIMLEKLGKEIKFEKGLRKTDKETMEIVEMVLHGKVQRRLVTAINCAGGKAIGISGRDGRMIIAKPHAGAQSGDMVGDVKSINMDLVFSIMDLGLIPVISSIAPDEQGQAYNINADTVCAEVAKAMRAHKMLLMTDTPGILRDKADKNSLISELKLEEAKELIKSGIVTDGMIPKLECCINAVSGAVGEAVILNGLEEHSLLLEIFTDHGAGTAIKN